MNHEPMIELYQPRRASTGEWMAAATVHTREGQIRIVATAPQPVVARALAKAQAALTRYLGVAEPSVEPMPMSMPDYPVMDMPPPPDGMFATVKKVLAQLVRPAGVARQSALGAARQLTIAAQTLAEDESEDLPSALDAAARVVEQARDDEAYRQRLIDSIETSQGQTRLARLVSVVLDAEDQDGPEGVAHLQRLARAVELLRRALDDDTDAQQAITEIALRASKTGSVSAARAAGALYVAIRALLPDDLEDTFGGYDDEALWADAVGAGMGGAFRPTTATVGRMASPFDDLNLLRALQAWRVGWRRRSVMSRVA